MLSLYKYELKKIISQKYFLLASIIMSVFLLAVGITPVFTDGVPTLIEKQAVSNRYIDNELINEAKSNNGEGIYQYIVEFVNNCQLIKNDSYNAKQIYEARLETIEKAKRDSYLSDKETKYWDGKSKEIETPFIYYADSGYVETYELIYMVSMFTMILINIGISGIFADEKQTGTDQILYSTKYGRSKLFSAKLLASITLGIIIPIILFTLLFTTELCVFGIEGYNTPIQVHSPTSLYKITMDKAMLYSLTKIISCGIMWSLFCVLLSILTAKHQAAQSIALVVMMLSMVSIPEKFGIISYIWHFFPSSNIGNWMFAEYRMLNLFGILFNDFIATPIIWGALSIVFVIISKNKFKNYEVLGR